MPRPRINKTKKARGKRVSYQLISTTTKDGAPIYDMLNRNIEKHHDELTNARIALAWSTSWKPDADGRMKLGQCKKASDLDRELAPYDFVILLNKAWWEEQGVTDAHRVALLDHELCHATVKFDREGEPEVDAKGRRVYRTRKHDIEEFAEVVQRHGLYKRDLENMAIAMTRSKQSRLFIEQEAERINGKKQPIQAPTPTTPATH